MIRRPPRSTRTDTLFPYTTLFQSAQPIALAPVVVGRAGQGRRRHAQAAAGHQLLRPLEILGGEGDGPNPLAPGVEVRAHAIAERALAVRGDHVERHVGALEPGVARSEEQTSELQSLLRSSYAVFCLKQK